MSRQIHQNPPQTRQEDDGHSNARPAVTPPVSDMEHHLSDEMFGLRIPSSEAAAISPCRLGKVEFTSDDVLALFDL